MEMDDTLARGPDTLGGAYDEPMPRSIGRYNMLHPIGQGGMGVVYLAHDPELDRPVAIKVLREHITARLEAQGHTSPLMAEARVMAKLNHENVVTIYDVGRVGDQIFIAMEYIEGTTLELWRRSRQLGWREIVPLFVAAGEGLAAAHGAGIVHRDFKPANVFVADDGTVRVGDFGLARPAASAQTERYGSEETSDRSTVVGTPAYMAPEQHAARHTDARADQFSFCIALYEAVYAARPFAGRNVVSLAHKKLSGEVEPPPKGSGVPGWLRAVILRGLSKDPSDRFGSMDELLQALRRPLAPRRWMLLWGSGVVPLAALVIVLALTGREHDRCGAGEAHFAGVWDPDRRSTVRDRFLASGVGYGQRSFEIAAARLDTWRASWTDAHRQTCEMAAAPADAAALDDRFACMQRQLHEVRALIDVFATADASVVEGATRATGHLPSPERCADPTRAGPAPTPAELEVLERLDEAKALHLAGAYEDALRVARIALSDAEATESASVRAQALHRVGATQYRRADYEAALTHLDAAVWLAAEAGLDPLAASAATLLVTTVGRRLGRPQEGLQWARHATAFLDRGEQDVLARARVHNNVGQVHEARGALEEALRSYTSAQELKAGALAPDDPELATTLLNLGAVAGKMGRLADARAPLEQSLEILERAHGPNHPAIAGPLTNLGNVARAARELPEAAAYYRRAAEIREAASGPTSPTLAAPLSNLGVVLSAMGEHIEAEAIHARVAGLFEAAHGREHPRVASALINRGDAAFRIGDLDAAARHFVAAAEILSAVAPEHRMRLTALLNLGEVQLAQERWAQARTSYAQAWALAKAREAPAMHGAQAAVGLGRALVEQGQAADAIAPLSWARSRLRESDDPPGPVGRTEFLLAQALRGAGRTAEALEHARKARSALVAAEGETGSTVVAVDRWRAHR